MVPVRSEMDCKVERFETQQGGLSSPSRIFHEQNQDSVVLLPVADTPRVEKLCRERLRCGQTPKLVDRHHRYFGTW